MGRTLSLIVRNLAFTIVVPGAGGAYVPWLILTRHGGVPAPAAWYAVPVIAAGVCLYAWCAGAFAAVGRGTPGPWDAPRQVVAAGPYRWVRNPIYLAAVLIVSGEAWLFGSADLLLYAAALAAACHLIVIGYEEPRLRARFGGHYEAYRHAVPRWVPHRPRPRSQPHRPGARPGRHEADYGRGAPGGIAGDRGRGEGDSDMVTIYWRPGCMFCLRLRLVLWLRRAPARWINIWSDPSAAEFVRSVAGGNETVPTVVIDGEAVVNPAPRRVAAAARRDAG